MQKGKRFPQKSFGAVGIQLLQHKFVQHGGREQRLLVAEGLPDEDEGHDGLAARVEPEGVEGVQRLLGGLVERQVEGEAAVVLPAALVGKEVGVAAGVQTVKALVQRKAGAELGQAGRAVLAAEHGHCRRRQQKEVPCLACEFELHCVPPARAVAQALCQKVKIFKELKIL